MVFFLALWLFFSRFFWQTSAGFAVLQDDANSNTSGIRICVLLVNPPGTLFRDNIPTGYDNLNDLDCVFDDGLEQSSAYTYALQDSLYNVVSQTFCTHPAPPYDVSAVLFNITSVKIYHSRRIGLPSEYVVGIHEDQRPVASFIDNPDIFRSETTLSGVELFKNYTFFVYQVHFCRYNLPDEVGHESERTLANTIRGAPRGVSIAVTDEGHSFVTISITAQDFDWSLDYIMRRDGAIVGTFTHPDYFGDGNHWNDTGVQPATEYHYQMEEKDHMNGLSVFSNEMTVCTDPPEVLTFDYRLDSTLKVTFTWDLPPAFYEKPIAAQITTNYLVSETRTNLASPYTWSYPLDPSTSHHFHIQLYIDCDTRQYTDWTPLVIRANKPEISVSLVDHTTVTVSFPSYHQFLNIRLFLDGNEVRPAPSLYPWTLQNMIQGTTHSIYIEAEQFQELTQSSVAQITMPAVTTTTREPIPATTIFVCPTPSAPVELGYQLLDDTTIRIEWIQTDILNDAQFSVTFDVLDPNDNSVPDNPISETHFEWSGELRPLTHYIFNVRSILHCEQNGENAYSDWIQIDAYTPPPKPVLTIVEAGRDYVVLDVHNHEIYESTSLFVNDIKHNPDPPSWPYGVDILEVTLSYRFSVEVSKYGQTARSADVVWSQPTTEPPPTTTTHSTTLTPFVCPIPSPPTNVGYSSIDNSTIVLVWTAPHDHISGPEFELKYEVQDSLRQAEEDITATYFTWSGSFAPLTHYSFYVRSSLFCHENGDTKYSDWTEVDAYTPPSKPTLVIVERGEDYVVLDVYNSEMYDSISLFINDVKQDPDPPAWPYRVTIDVSEPLYIFHIEVDKYGKKARSDEIDWRDATAEYGKTDSDEASTGVVVWAILAGILIFVLLVLLIGFVVRAKWHKRRVEKGLTTTMNVYNEYEGPSDSAYMPPLGPIHEEEQPTYNSNIDLKTNNVSRGVSHQSNVYNETELGDEKKRSEGKKLSSYHNAGLETSRASLQNDYWATEKNSDESQ